MATKKKTVKKTVAKRAYNREVPVTKRKYTRKLKAGPTPVIQQESAEAIPNQDSSQNSGPAETADTKSCQAESTISILRQIDVIDLRSIPPQGRFAVLAMLQNEGYITQQLESLLSYDMILAYMYADALSLNHNNKLVSPEEWSEASASYAISRPMVRYDAMIGFSTPDAAYEETMKVGNATYVRVA